MKKTIFIINPAAGKGKGRKSHFLISQYLKESSSNAEVVVTNMPKHATDIASQLSPNIKKVISVGGDGTLNEVINGLDLSIGREIGILPIGSGNDFATALKMGKDLVSNIKVVLSNSAQTKKVDIGFIKYTEFENNQIFKENRFINSLGFGFDAYVAYLNQSNKKFSGITSYIFAVIKALNSFKSAEICYSINDEKDISGKKLLLAIGNSKTTGGGFYLTPDAEIDDGVFNTCIIDDISNFKLLQYLPRALINKIKGLPEVHLGKFKILKVDVKNPDFFVHCDGENITKNICSAEISILQHELKFILG